MRSMYWQLGILETISAFAYRPREIKKKKIYIYIYSHIGKISKILRPKQVANNTIIIK